jgi:sarcosine reductase
MALELGTFPVKDVVLDGATRLEGETLYIDHDGLASVIMEDPRIKRVKVEVVKPGENARIIHVRDVVEPRLKAVGPGCIFPGILGGTEPVGKGTTFRLGGITLMESAQMPDKVIGLRGTSRDTILDMVGPGALSPFTETINIVPCMELDQELSDLEFENAVQRSGFRAAGYLAEVTKGLTPPQLEVFDLDQRNPALPNVVYIHQISGVGRGTAQGVDFYGLRLGEILPTFVQATEFLDGALVTDAIASSAIKVPTWQLQNHPIVMDLLRRHGKDVNFLGVILMRIRFTTHPEKEMVSAQAANLARQLGAQGAIVTWPGGGNMFIESMLTAQECEKRGVKAVLMTYEHGGKTGDEPPLLYMSPDVNAIVSTGSLDRPISLPSVDRVVGGDMVIINPETHEAPRPAKDPIDLDWYLPMYGAVDHYGLTKQSCIAY